jgi:chemotaxis signal transduction protein
MKKIDVSGSVAAGKRRFLTFHVERRLYALPAEWVVEVIRIPLVARVPQTPKALLGVANLRGAVLPLACSPDFGEPSAGNRGSHPCRGRHVSAQAAYREGPGGISGSRCW